MKINTFNTNSGYCYLYASKQQYLIALQEITKWIIENSYNGNVVDCDACLNDVSLIEKYGIDEIKYSIKFIEFLHNNGILKNYIKDDTYKPLHIRPYNVIDNFATANDIVLEVTENCNLACKYCIYGELYDFGAVRKHKVMDFKTAKTIIDYKVKLWTSNYNSSTKITKLIGFYGGEPLLNFDLIKNVVDYIRNIEAEYDIKFRFSMTTNGTLLNKHIDYLVDNDFLLTISLDGNKFNNQYRVYSNGAESYSDVVSNVNFIQNKYPDFFNINVSFNSVLHNYSNVEELYEYFANIYKKTPIVAPLNPYTKNNKIIAYHYRRPEYIETLSNNIYNLKDDVTKLFTHDEYISHYSILVNNNIGKTFCSGTCIPFSKKIFVTANGDILMCEKISQKFKVGKIQNDEVRIDWDEAANLFNNTINKRFEQCKDCYASEVCSECIFTLEDYPCAEYTSHNAYINGLKKKVYFYELNTDCDGFYLYLHQFVYLNIRGNKALLYNELSGKSLVVSKNDDSIYYEVLCRISRNADERQGIILPSNEICDTELLRVVNHLRVGFWGDIQKINNNKVPFVRKPITRVINDVEYTHIDDEYLISYRLKMSVLELNINLGGYYKITKREDPNLDNNIHILYDYLDNIVNQCSGCRLLKQINIYVDANTNLIAVKSFVEKFETSNISLCIHVRVSDLVNNEDFAVLKCAKLYVYMEASDTEFGLYKSILTNINLETIPLVCIDTYNDIELKQLLDNQFHISSYPFPVANNLESNIELWKRDVSTILATNLSIREINNNGIINKNIFGKVFIDVDGNISAINEVDHKHFNIKQNSIFDLVYYQLKHKKGWYLVRSQIAPCKECIYSNMCPPISVVECDHKMYNLCNISEYR